jgi:uncharacterized protein YcfL
LQQFTTCASQIRLLLALGLLIMAGCSSDQGNLRLTSMDQKHEFCQKFTSAYVERNESGDADIVLVQDAAPRQLVHIRVFWFPMAGVKAEHPINANASISWCFLSQNCPQQGVVEYSGSGLVELDDVSDGATVTIRKAWMKEQCCHGMLVDPLGPSILQGTFHAVYDSGQVKQIMTEMKAASNISTEAQAPAESPVN